MGDLPIIRGCRYIDVRTGKEATLIKDNGDFLWFSTGLRITMDEFNKHFIVKDANKCG